MKELDSRTEIGQRAEINLEDHHTETDLNLHKASGEEGSEEETMEMLGMTLYLAGGK